MHPLSAIIDNATEPELTKYGEYPSVFIPPLFRA